LILSETVREGRFFKKISSSPRVENEEESDERDWFEDEEIDSGAGGVFIPV
jgi:hypothetical protein